MICIKFGHHKCFNTYDLDSREYGIGYTNGGQEFYFDKEDYWKIKDICWHMSSGYLRGIIPGENKREYLHRFVMDATKDEMVDHINHILTDNRKSNLRKCTRAQNVRNHVVRSDNTSGVSGVWYSTQRHKWYVQITKDHKTISVGSFDNFEDAVTARNSAEEKYYQDYSYTNSLAISEAIV